MKEIPILVEKATLEKAEPKDLVEIDSLYHIICKSEEQAPCGCLVKMMTQFKDKPTFLPPNTPCIILRNLNPNGPLGWPSHWDNTGEPY